MKVTLFQCGPAANESELKAFEHLKCRLQSTAGDDEWVLLTNLAFSVTHQLQSDEIDTVAIGPPGVRVIEVKHWTVQWIDAHPDLVQQEAERVTNKARRIGTTLRKFFPELPRLDGAILLTQEPSKVKRLVGEEVRGVQFHSLNDWKGAIGFDAPRVLAALQVARLGNVLEPKVAVAMDGSLRRLAGYVNLELRSPKEERFRRVYKGSHPARRDRVVLHLYDLSASDDKNAETKAKREFEALHRLQLHSWAPRILDSYQDAPGYAGEMFFFTVVDPAAPSIEDRATDTTWTTTSRLAFARNTVRALAELHEAGTTDEPIIHRNLTPQTILVRHDNSPLFTGFERTKIPSEISVASSSIPTGPYLPTVAPEVQAQGFAAADHRSDVYSLCACLRNLFQGREDDQSQRAAELLAQGLANEPEQRGTLKNLEVALSQLLGESVPPPTAPPARFWTEDQVIRFRDRDYRIVDERPRPQDLKLTRALGLCLPLELAFVFKRHAADLFHDQLSDRHSRPEQNRGRAEVDDLQRERATPARMHGRCSEVNQQTTPCTAALPLDSGRQARLDVFRDRQLDRFARHAEDEHISFEQVCRLLIQVDSPRVSGNGLGQVWLRRIVHKSARDRDRKIRRQCQVNGMRVVRTVFSLGGPYTRLRLRADD